MTALLGLLWIVTVVLAYILGKFDGERKATARYAELARWRSAISKTQEHKEK